MGHADKNGMQKQYIHSKFSTCFLILFFVVVSWLKIKKNMIVSAAILCPAVYISDINKLGMYGQSFFFLLFIGKEHTDITALRGAQIWSKKVLFLDTNIDRKTQWSMLMKICAHFLCFQASLIASLVQCSLKNPCSARVLLPQLT